MKILKLVLTTVICISFYGCATYQYITLSSDSPASKNHEIVVDNDTLQVRYNFYVSEANVLISIHNKTPKPILIDWSMSSIVQNGKSYSYIPAEVKMSGSYSGGSYRIGNRYSSTSGSLSGKIEAFPEKTFMPPQSFIEEKRQIAQNKFLSLATPLEAKVKIKNIYNAEVNGKSREFSEKDSPFSFRSYLSYYFSENSAQVFHIETKFWTKEVVEVKIPPSDKLNRPANQMYFKRPLEN
jgi:hypothetical protein